MYGPYRSRQPSSSPYSTHSHTRVFVLCDRQVAEMEQTLESVMQGNTELQSKVNALEEQESTLQGSLAKSEARLAEAMKRVRQLPLRCPLCGISSC